MIRAERTVDRFSPPRVRTLPVFSMLLWVGFACGTSLKGALLCLCPQLSGKETYSEGSMAPSAQSCCGLGEEVAFLPLTWHPIPHLQKPQVVHTIPQCASSGLNRLKEQISKAGMEFLQILGSHARALRETTKSQRDTRSPESNGGVWPLTPPVTTV